MWYKLADTLHLEPDLLGERITAENLRALYEKGHAVVHVEDGEIIGYAALWETPHPKWLEVGSVWVHQNHRDKKIASLLFKECVARGGNGWSILVVTHNPKVIHLAQQVGFMEATCTTWFDLPWEVTCGPCDRLKDDEKPMCPFRAKRGKCALFFA